ncbi:GNAT family N-acetyltransferase [Streptomyces sp. NBC_01431]|uniref:GNAT family N-acetyltransferase n=1 Tax=Streptomyces sp. NBC_01431 TaxID=2903863 RepID=UPI002E30D21F|nr:GNAT family N-acetyltransferase [Streptomyces sp. NBC_01431]
MPPTDASTDAGAGPTPTAGETADDTLDLHLPDELVALFGDTDTGPDSSPPAGPGKPRGSGPVGSPGAARPATADPAAAQPLAADSARLGSAPGPLSGGAHRRATVHPVVQDLLDSPGDWAPATTSVGVFHLVPVRLERDLPLLTQWMNDPAVAAFWDLAGQASVTAAHLRAQLDGDGRSVPCLGVLGTTPMSYWEIYRADLDPLARHYPARPHDTGVHLLIGGVADRGRGVGTTLLRAVADLIIDNRPHCPRVIAEPDLRNTPSVSAFLSAGFRFHAEVDLPDKRAALMVRDRALRNLL